VIVIRGPVGIGKSAVADTIQSWQNCGAILAPSNIHVKQFLKDFDMCTVWAQRDYGLGVRTGPRGGKQYYHTDNPDEIITNEEWYRKNIYKHGPKGSQYSKDLAASRLVKSKLVTNYTSFLAHKFQRKVLIVDEAHRLLGQIQSHAATRLWEHLTGFPEDASSLADVIRWAEEIRNPDKHQIKLLDALRALKPSTTVEFTEEMYRGEMRRCLKLSPLDCSEEPPFYWPPKTKKIVLMSATINEVDIKAMGLADRRVVYIDVPSPIPAARRPIYLSKVCNMSYNSQDENLEAAVDFILRKASDHPQKGFIHVSYDLAKKLKPRLQNSPSATRFMFHDRDNKRKQYEKFYDSDPTEGKIIVGSGLHEGIDLKFDIARWQIMVKTPYPSLADGGYRYLAMNDPEYYLWLTSREVLQASGRICRDPDDFGITYLLDTNFQRWYDDATNSNLLPEWFTEAVV
jgi:Rad3-related DNA helicase